MCCLLLLLDTTNGIEKEQPPKTDKKNQRLRKKETTGLPPGGSEALQLMFLPDYPQRISSMAPGGSFSRAVVGRCHIRVGGVR